MNLILTYVFLHLWQNKGEKIIDPNALSDQLLTDGLVIETYAVLIVAPHLWGGRSRGCKNNIGRNPLQKPSDPDHGFHIRIKRGKRTIAEQIARIPQAIIPVDNIAAGQSLLPFMQTAQRIRSEPAVLIWTEDRKLILQRLLDNRPIVVKHD